MTFARLLVPQRLSGLEVGSDKREQDKSAYGAQGRGL